MGNFKNQFLTHGDMENKFECDFCVYGMSF